jgi:DUF4097 and DUF4098 domain-containing protein YvlB
MTEERRRILDMLSEGKVTVEEAERLLEALQGARRETRKKSRINAPLSPIPGVEALQDTLGGLGEEIGRGLEESLSEWSEGDNGDRDEDDKTSMRDDTFAVGANPRLVVRGFNGRVRVRAGEPGSIRVRARLKKPRGIKYSAVQEGDLVTVEAKPNRPSEGFRHGQHAGANIEVTVPGTTSVDLATSNGPVELRGTEGGAEVQTKNGPIRVEQFKGDLNAKTKNAPIAVKTLSGSAVLSTLNSRVSIEDGRGRFEVRTINGPIKFQGSMEPKSHNKLSTLNGNIKVALDADPSLTLTAATTNGRVRCEVPGFVAAVEKRHELEGTMGAGEAELIAETKNGSIVVQ